MKKILAVCTFVSTVFFVLNGCMHGSSPDGENLQGDIVSKRVPVKNNSLEIKISNDSIAARIDKPKLYKPSEITSLGLKCTESNTQANEILAQIREEEIYELNYTNIPEAANYIYKTRNPQNLTTAELKKMFKNCGGDADNLPLKAEKDYILWGSTTCNVTEGAELRSCMNLMNILNDYLSEIN